MDKWERWNHYQKYGEWPEKKSPLSSAQKSASLHDEIHNWEKNNPVQASYDNDGNPVER